MRLLIARSTKRFNHHSKLANSIENIVAKEISVMSTENNSELFIPSIF